jgi:hypothetical protein
VFPPLLLIVGILVIIYGVAMLTITRAVAPSSAEPDIEAEEKSALVTA